MFAHLCECFHRIRQGLLEMCFAHHLAHGLNLSVTISASVFDCVFLFYLRLGLLYFII